MNNCCHFPVHIIILSHEKTAFLAESGFDNSQISLLNYRFNVSPRSILVSIEQYAAFVTVLADSAVGPEKKADLAHRLYCSFLM